MKLVGLTLIAAIVFTQYAEANKRVRIRRGAEAAAVVHTSVHDQSARLISGQIDPHDELPTCEAGVQVDNDQNIRSTQYSCYQNVSTYDQQLVAQFIGVGRTLDEATVNTGSQQAIREYCRSNSSYNSSDIRDHGRIVGNCEVTKTIIIKRHGFKCQKTQVSLVYEHDYIRNFSCDSILNGSDRL